MLNQVVIDTCGLSEKNSKATRLIVTLSAPPHLSDVTTDLCSDSHYFCNIVEELPLLTPNFVKHILLCMWQGNIIQSHKNDQAKSEKSGNASSPPSSSGSSSWSNPRCYLPAFQLDMAIDSNLSTQITVVFRKDYENHRNQSWGFHAVGYPRVALHDH